MSGNSELNYLARSFKRVIAKYSNSSLVLTTADTLFFLLFAFLFWQYSNVCLFGAPSLRDILFHDHQINIFHQHFVFCKSYFM